MPLFFKLWFAIVAICALTIIGGTVFAIITVTSDPAVIGRAAAEVVSGFKETAR